MSVADKRDLRLIYAAAFLRAVSIGLTGVVLGIYLSRVGFSATRIGFVVAGGLAGAASATLFASLRADRLGRRRVLVLISLLSGLSGAGLALSTSLAAILGVAFFGMLNGMGRDRGPAYALEQAIIPQVTAASRRTWALSVYHLILDAGHALGGLGGGLPFVLARHLRIGLIPSYRFTFGVLATLSLLSAFLYSLLSRRIEVAVGAPAARDTVRISAGSKRIVAKLAAITGLDSLGGGFLASALLAYWFFHRFGVSEESLGPLFFAGRILNSASYLVASWLARRMGLLNTMVFTHLPSSLFLLAIPFAPSFSWAMWFFLARECLVEMDVATRQSYTVAVVQAEERTFASGVTNLTRNVAWAVAPSFAGCFMQYLALSAPLFIGGGMKIAYDLLLFAAFRRVKPPEEQFGAVSGQRRSAAEVP